MNAPCLRRARAVAGSAFAASAALAVALAFACGAPPEGPHEPIARLEPPVLRGIDTTPSPASVAAIDAAARVTLRAIVNDERRPLVERARALRLWAASSPGHPSRAHTAVAADAVDDVLRAFVDDEQVLSELRVQAAWARVRRAGDDVIAVARELLTSSSADLRAVGVLAMWEDCSGEARALLVAHTAIEPDPDTATLCRARLRRWPRSQGCGHQNE